MNHQPFETWLLEEQPLSAEQKRELQSHLRTCDRCTALVETGLALHSARMARPAAGFATRFQARLEARRIAERRRRFWGIILFSLSGLGVAAWLAVPWLAQAADSPAEWVSLVIGYALFVVTTLQTVVEVGSVLVRVAPGFMPSYFWMIVASGVAGLGLLSSVSIWRYSVAGRSLRNEN
ncbi:MAG: hypothetical protein ACM3QS_05345 [Bacteroidota bacterium]